MEKIRKLMAKKLNNFGVSLVELVCAIGIMTILGASVAAVMVVSANSYTRGTTEAELQQETQLMVNQINNLIQDATSVTSEPVADGDGSVIGTKLTIVKESETIVIYPDGSGNVNVQIGGEIQPLAENVGSFVADTTDYAETGCVQMYVELEKANRNYAANYSVTSRNPLVETEVKESNIMLTCDDEMLIEPNVTIDIPIVITGATADFGIEWELRGNTDTNTTLLEQAPVPGVEPEEGKTILELKASKNEMAERLFVVIKSKEKKNDGITPKAEKQITVYNRRVTAVTVNGTKSTGNDKKSGAKYTIKANVSGLNLPKTPLSEDATYNSSSPYVIQWEFAYSVDGTKQNLVYNSSAHTLSNDYCEIKLNNIDFTTIKNESNGNLANGTTTTKIVFDYLNYDGTDEPFVELRLKRDMDTYDTFVATAICLHPNGRNRSFINYVDDNIFGYWQLNSVAYRRIDDNFKRGSDNAQGTFSQMDSLKSIIQARTRVADYLYECQKLWRYREVTSMASDGTPLTFGPWTDWMYMMENGWNAAINVRPGGSLCLAPAKAYNIEIRWQIVNRNNRNQILWPFSDTPKSEYSMTEIIVDPVSVTYRIKNVAGIDGNLVVEGSDPIAVNAGTQIKLEKAGFKFIDQNVFDGNKVTYILQRKNISGSWVGVDSRDGSAWKEQSDRFDCFANIRRKGEYRILVQGVRMRQNYYDFNAARNNPNDYNNMYKSLGESDAPLYDEGTGKGIFCFNVAESTADWNSRYFEYNDLVYNYSFSVEDRWWEGKKYYTFSFSGNGVNESNTFSSSDHPDWGENDFRNYGFTEAYSYLNFIGK